MKFSTASAITLAAATVASASPITKRQAASGVTDIDILNYALTLEYLENSFYSGALAQFDDAAFQAAGFPAWVRPRFEQIAQHEASHVQLLSSALGSSATMPCNYSFPYTDPVSFAALSGVIESVGVSAYLGAAAYIANGAYLTVAGSILSVEAEHSAWVNSAVGKTEPWVSGPYATPQDFSNVYSIASEFITSCPSSNPALPVKAFPALTVTPADPVGQTASLNYTSSGQAEYLILYSGLTVLSLNITNEQATIPSGLEGIAYVVVSTTSNTTAVDDSNTVAGPAIIDVPFNSAASNGEFTGTK